MDDKAAQERIAQLCDVSRETLEHLNVFSRSLVKWNKKINLVAPSSVSELWLRHILDSAQLVPLIPNTARTLCDIGSGGGFPGLVIAILAKETHPKLKVTLIESDRRKSAFLQTMIGQLDLPASTLVERIEKAAPQQADVVTARALAPLGKLLSYVDCHLSDQGRAVLLKGGKSDVELDEALASWTFDLQKRSSETSADAVVLEISSLRRR